MKRVAAVFRRRDLARLAFEAMKLISVGAGRGIARERMSEQRKSTLSLIGEAISQASRLLSSEMVLARAEIAEKMTTAIATVVSIVGAAVFLIVALILLLQALVAWLVEMGWRPSQASLAVGTGIGIAALAAIFIAKGRLARWRIAPSRSLKQAALTMDVVRGRA